MLAPGAMAEAGTVMVVPLSVPTGLPPLVQEAVEKDQPAGSWDSLMVTAVLIAAAVNTCVPATVVLPSTCVGVSAWVVVTLPVVWVVLVSVKPKGPPVPAAVALRSVMVGIAAMVTG